MIISIMLGPHLMRLDNKHKYKDYKMPPSFFQTVMGRKFFEGTVPAMLSQVKRLNDNLEKIISLLENNETLSSDLLKEDDDE